MAKKPPNTYLTGRGKTVNVKTAKRREKGSTRWLQRQLNDPYVIEAQKQGYRSRAVFKIMQMDDKLNFLKPGQVIIDLGAAPGGWTQLAVERVNPTKTDGLIVGLDILEMDDLPGALIFQKDFNDDDAPQTLIDAMGGRKADVVMSDIAPNTTGHKQTDHLRIMYLAELAWDFAKQVLNKDGTFIAKVFQGGAEKELLVDLKKHCKTIRHIKPEASRKESSEVYVVASGFKNG